MRGVLGPGEEVDVTVSCHALSDGQHHSIVKVIGPGGMQCLEAFAAVVTPLAVVSRPKLDLGATYLGVTTRATFTMKNLSLLPLDFRWSVEGGAPQGSAEAEMKIRPEGGTLEAGAAAELLALLCHSDALPLVSRKVRPCGNAE